MKETNFNVMMATASEKYTKLIDAAYKMKNGSDIDFEKFIKLIHSVYMDQSDLIFKLCCEDAKKETKTEIMNIETPNF